MEGQDLARQAGSHTPQGHYLPSLLCFSLPGCPTFSFLPCRTLTFPFYPVSHPSTATPGGSAPLGPRALLQDGARRFGSTGSELTLLRKGRRERAGAWVTYRGAVGGAAAVAVFTLGAGEKARDSPTLGNPGEGQGRGRWGKLV